MRIITYRWATLPPSFMAGRLSLGAIFAVFFLPRVASGIDRPTAEVHLACSISGLIAFACVAQLLANSPGPQLY